MRHFCSPFRRSALTLIEILLYFTLLAIVLFFAMSFALQIGDLYGLSSNQEEVHSAENSVEENLRTALVNAQSVNVADSSFGVDEGRLSLEMSMVEIDPSVFYLENGMIYLQEGSAAPVALFSELVQADYFRVTRVTYDKTPDQIQVSAQFSIRGIDRTQVEATAPLYLTLTLRQ